MFIKCDKQDLQFRTLIFALYCNCEDKKQNAEVFQIALIISKKSRTWLLKRNSG